ncbi:MAG: lasso peptide biosynthesis protein [Candidatus Promineifilaceae bacterium]
MSERVRNIWLLLRLLPALATNARQRALLREMMAFVRQLPAMMQQPLPDAMRSVTVAHDTGDLVIGSVRDLADLASVLERRSLPGICLKRSLTRYRYLHDRLPLGVVFGAKLVKGAAKRDLAGHAWLELDGRAWFESAEYYEHFTPLFRWPPA